MFLVQGLGNNILVEAVNGYFCLGELHVLVVFLSR